MKRNEKIFPQSLLALSIGLIVQSASAQEVEEQVVVTGIRHSIQSAVELKKEANKVVDVINSEDVGKFPDRNVLDALQRITGVQIGRDETGEASGFTVRGISQNRVELNGRSVAAGDGEGRNLNLSDIPSELISELEVIKSPTADMIEGSLGATVNLKTARPFKFKKPLYKVNAKALYGDNVSEGYGNISTTLANNWDDTAIGKFGVLANITYNKNEVQGDRMRVNRSFWRTACTSYALTRPDGSGLNRRSGTDYGSNNCNNLENADMEAQRLYAPTQFTHLQYSQERERKSANVTFQWAPTDNQEYIMDLQYFDSKNIAVRETLNLRTNLSGQDIDPALFEGEEDGHVVSWENVELGEEVELRDRLNNVVETVRPVKYADIQTAYVHNAVAQGEPKETERFSFGLEGKWTFNNFNINAELSHTNANHRREYYATGLARWSGNRWNQQNQILRLDQEDLDNGEAIRPWGQSASIDLRSDREMALDWQGHSLTDMRYFRLNNAQADGWIQKPQETAIRFDVDWQVDFGDIQSLEFGVRLTENIMDRTERFRFRCNRNNAFGGNGPNGNSFDASEDRACSDPSVSTTDFFEAHPDAFQTTDDFYTESDTNAVNEWIQLDNNLFVDRKEVWRERFGFYESGADSEVPGSTGYTSLPLQRYKITEETSAAYVKANFEGDLLGEFTYRGNLGVRAVNTEVSSETYVAQAGAEDIVTQHLDHDYFELLPSANIAFAYDDSTIIRLAAAKVMVRPNFDQLKPTGSFNTAAGSCAYLWPDDPFNLLGREVPSAETDAQAAAIEEWSLGNTPCPGIRTQTASLGNLELNPYISYNYDLSLEYYWGDGNSASGTVFYRDVRAGLSKVRRAFAIPVDPDTQLPGSYEEGTEYWRSTQPVNSGEETREGIELQYTQFFDFLPSILSHFGTQLNYTYADGETFDPVYLFEGERTLADGTAVTAETADDVENADAFRDVIDLSTHTYNASLFFDNGPLNLRLSYNFRDSYYTGDETNVYVDSSDRLDFSSSYNFDNGLGMTFGIQNLLRSRDHRYYNDSKDITVDSRYSDIVYSLGANYRF